MNKRLGPIDGLRGIAVLLVVWFHIRQISGLPGVLHVGGYALDFDPLARTGFIGVDLFFFLSGFCLYFPYAEALFDGAPLRSTADFFYRRALKILPSYWMSIGLMVAFGIAGITSISDGLRQVVLHLLFIHTWFPDSFHSINDVLWSLGVEVEFYLFFPLIRPHFDRRPLATFGALAALALGYRLFALLDPVTLDSRIDQLPGTIDLFAAGMLAAYLARALPSRAPKLASRRTIWTIVALVGAAVFAATIASMNAANPPSFPSPWYVFGRDGFDLAFFALALGSLFAWRWWQALLANRALRFLAVISYNLYLWHLVITRVLLDHRFLPYPGDPQLDPRWQLAYTGIAFAASIAVGSLFTFALERPLLRLRPGFGILVRRAAPAR
ncbi:MAG: acyltransferase family protein [Vulcanimicrobiaceae bacterium]